MSEFTVRDFLRVLEMLGEPDSHPDLREYIRETRSKVLPDCLKQVLWGKVEGEPCCPEWPHTCGLSCAARRGTLAGAAAAPLEEPNVGDFLLALEVLARQEAVGVLEQYLREIRQRLNPACLEAPFYVRIPPPCPEWPVVCGVACRPQDAQAAGAETPDGKQETTFGDFLRSVELLAERRQYPAVREFLSNFRIWLDPACLRLPFYLKFWRSCPEWPYVCETGCAGEAEAGRALKSERAARGGISR